MQKKKGISLIVLVITIIVMIILAAAIIISINNANVMNKANQAVSDSDFATIKTAANLEYANILMGENTGDKWQGEYIKDKLIEQGVLTEDSAKLYKIRNNGEVVRLQTEQEYNEMYKEELAKLKSNYYTITDGVFNLTDAGKTAVENEELKTLVIPYGVTKTAYNMLYKNWGVNGICHKVEKIVFPDTVEVIDTMVEDNIDSFSKLHTVVLSKNVKSFINMDRVGDSYFYYEQGLKNSLLVNNKSQTSNNGLVIQDGVLIDASNAKGHVVIPNTVDIIATQAFGNNNNITSVIIPNTVEKIEFYAFSCCPKLEKVEFQGKIPDIGVGIFDNDNNLNISDSLRQQILNKNSKAFNAGGLGL